MAHLAGNVYGTPGTLTARPGLLTVELEPAPLQVVLDLAGLDEARLAATRWRLRLPELASGARCAH